MNKIFRYSLALVAVLMGLVSCSSDDDYKAATISGNQVFFSNELGKTVNLSSDESSFTVPLSRYVTDEAITVNLNVTDESGKLTIPSSVSFAAGEARKDIVVGYNPDDFELGVFKNVEIAIANQEYTTPYGAASYKFKVGLPEPFVSIGTGTFTDGFFMDETYEVEIFQNQNQPNVYRIMNPYDEAIEAGDIGGLEDGGSAPEYLEIRLIQPGNKIGETEVTQEGLVYWDPVSTGIYISNYATTIGIAHASALSSGAVESAWLNSKVANYKEDGTPGVVQLAPFYYLVGDGRGWNYTDQGTITIVFPDFSLKDYSVEVDYLGAFVSKAEKTYAETSFTLGEDVEEVKYALVEGTDIDAAIEGIISGTIESSSIDESQSVKIPCDYTGKVSVVAVSYADGEPQDVGYATFKFEIGAGDWTTLGTGLYTEDIILGFYVDDDGNLLSPYTYEVEIQQSKSKPGIYRLVNPYGAPFPYNEEGDWDDSQDWNIEVNAADPDGVYIEKQETGVDWGDGQLIIQSLGSYYLDNGYDFDLVKSNGLFGTLKDGVITFPQKGIVGWFGTDGPYSANTRGAAKIVLPTADESQVKANKARKQAVKAAGKHRRAHQRTLQMRDRRLLEPMR